MDPSYNPAGGNPHMHVSYVAGGPAAVPNPHMPMISPGQPGTPFHPQAGMYHMGPPPGLYYSPAPYAMMPAIGAPAPTGTPPVTVVTVDNRSASPHIPMAVAGNTNPPPAGNVGNVAHAQPRSGAANANANLATKQSANLEAGQPKGADADEDGDGSGNFPPGTEYPRPLANHADLIADKALFMDRLNTFHLLIGSALRVPQMAGKELDLHLLYKEVTSKGGLLQVITERRWREVTVPFNFPPTTTSASFVLRKYYIALLHHFEQCHFFKRTGPLVPPPPVAPIYKKKSIPAASTSNPNLPEPLLHIGQKVAGFIHSKSSHGYFITVTIGGEQMHGILYHPPVVTPSAAAQGQDGQPQKKKRASVAPAGGHDAGANEGEAGATAGGLPLAGAGGGVELEGYEEGEEDMEGVDIGDEGEYEEFEADIET